MATRKATRTTATRKVATTRVAASRKLSAARATAARKAASAAKTAKRRARKSGTSIIETVKSVFRRVKSPRKRKAKR